MRPNDMQDDRMLGVRPLSRHESVTTSGGNIFTDAYEGAKQLVETYIIEPMREIVRQATSPDKS
jgi:hypothetical protein